MSTLQTRLPLLLAVVLALGMFIGQQLPRTASLFQIKDSDAAHNSDLAPTIEEILSYVEARYVDSLDFDSIKNNTIDHLLDQLDPHSVYISPEAAKAVDDDMNGGFEGIGIEFIMLEDTILVVTPLPGGPAEKAGIMTGDRLVTIDDAVVAGVKVKDEVIYKKLRGNKGEQVRLGIRRDNAPTLTQFTLARDVIPVKSVEISYMLDDRTGYIKVNRFTSRTHQEFMDALRVLCEEQKMVNLVLDLRDNPGGFLQEATDLLSQLFVEGKLLVYTEGRNDSKKEYKSSGRARFNVQNVAVLIDEGSASASEIVAGAIQDHDRGWVIGRRSYGKGLVQEQYPLSDGGQLRLTIARYFTPSGRCIQRDYKHTKDYGDEAARRLADGELSDGTKMKIADSTRYYTGLGRIVYGGGGVTPDIFIPIDTSFISPYFESIARYVPQFVSRWIETNGKGGFPTQRNDFVQQYKVPADMIEAFLAYTEKRGTPRNPAQFSKCNAEIQLRIKARIAKVLFGEEGLYRVLQSDDPAVEKAVQILRSGEVITRK